MIAGFMHDPIPSSVDPRLLAQAGSRLHGTVSLEGMTRLAGMVHALDGVADVELCFSIDEQKRFHIDGTIEARVELICQRCLQAFGQNLSTQPKLIVLVEEDQAATLPAEFDPLVVERFLAPAVLVEDELILALPLIPRHEAGQCVPLLDDAPETVSDDRVRHPFADLGRLLRENDD
jgi:uncharacterized protein